MRLIAGRLPRVTPDEVRRFVGTVEVRDAEAFAAELEVFMQEWLQRVELPASLEIALSRQAVEHALVFQAAALKADTRWTPGRTVCGERRWRVRADKKFIRALEKGRGRPYY